MIYSVEKMLGEHIDKISGIGRSDVENASADAKMALESNDKRTIYQACERLTQASHKAGATALAQHSRVPGRADAWPTRSIYPGKGWVV